jgi:hypothetical protein
VLPQRRRVQDRVGVRVVLQRMRVRVRTRVRVRVGLQGQCLGAQIRSLSSVHLTLRGEGEGDREGNECEAKRE